MIFTLTGAIDGSNKTFTSSTAFAPGSANLVLNGRIWQRTDASWGLTETSSTTVLLNSAPQVGDVVSLLADPNNNSGSTTWTWDPACTTPKDVVRFLVGDTDSTDQQVVDSTITAFLGLYPDTRKCAAVICRSRAAYWSKFNDFTNGALSESQCRARADAFSARAAELEQQLVSGTTTMLVGGVSYAQKQAIEDNLDAVPPLFRRGQFGTRGQRPTRRVTEQN